MLIRSIRFTLGCALLLLAAAGCQGSGGSAPSSSSPAGRAIVISSNQGSTTVIVPNADNNGVKTLTTEGNEHCAKCEEDALTYFKTGQISSTCPVCGAQRKVAHAVN